MFGATYGKSKKMEILPFANFSQNFMNFPQALSKTSLKGIKIGVVAIDKGKGKKQINWLKPLAPGAGIKLVLWEKLLNGSVKPSSFHILMITDPSGHMTDAFVKLIRDFSKAGTTIVLPAYTGPMKKDHDYTPWRNFINKVSASAVIVGMHGKAYQLGNLEFWKKVPSDTYVVHQSIDGFKAFNPNTMIDASLDLGAYYATAAIALLKAKEKAITPMEIKKRLKTNGRAMFWHNCKWERKKGNPEPYCRPFFSKESMEKWLKQNQDEVSAGETFPGYSLDAGLLLGLPPMGNGDWCFESLRIKEAHQMATGKGITVAILDHMFVKDDPAFKGRLKKPGSVVEGLPVFEEEAGHGTRMARLLVRTAPGVKIMPVRFCGGHRYGEADLYIKGIQYAVRNGADVISISHRAIPKDRIADLDRAIQKASNEGITVVYIHYQGQRQEVLVSGAIEFASFSKRKDKVYVIGTNFNDGESVYTWGLSPTAPIVAGVVAMMKEINPGLMPIRIKKMIRRKSKTTSDGYPLLDAKKAVDQVKSWI